MFSLIWAWTNGWANAGDLRCHGADHYFAVMIQEDVLLYVDIFDTIFYFWKLYQINPLKLDTKHLISLWWPYLMDHFTLRSFNETIQWLPCFHCDYVPLRLRWRHNRRDGVSNHQPHHCLLNRLIRRRSKKTSKLRVTGLCAGNSPGPMNSPHKWPVKRKMFPFDDVIMIFHVHFH